MINSVTSLHPWSACLTSLKEKLSDEAFTQWISPLKVFDMSEFQVSLAVPHNIDMDQLAKIYLGLIEHCFHEANGREARVHLRRMPTASHASSSTSAHPFTGMPAIDLNPNYTFAEFVVGSNSQFAYSAALAVAKDPGGTKFNPLLIYGGVGLGKTHLLQAIGNFAIAENPRKK